MARPRRSDAAKLEELSALSNSFLCKYIEEEPKIYFGPNDDMYTMAAEELFGSKYGTERYDGLHLRGKGGGEAYTKMVATAIQRAQTFPMVKSNQQENFTNSTCSWAILVNQIIAVTTHFRCSSKVLYTAIEILTSYQQRMSEDAQLIGLAIIKMCADWDRKPVLVKSMLKYLKLTQSEKEVEAIETRITSSVGIQVRITFL